MSRGLMSVRDGQAVTGAAWAGRWSIVAVNENPWKNIAGGDGQGASPRRVVPSQTPGRDENSANGL